MDSPGHPNTDHELLRGFLAQQGLTFLGVAAASGQGTELARQRYRQWVAQGRHGTMSYLERHEAGKYDPSLSLPGTRAVIIAGLGYHQPRPVETLGGLVSRYAWGRDYHKVMLNKLKRVVDALSLAWPDQNWRSFTDTAPLDERWWAEQAGATFTARNSLAINRELGSWFVLGEILTTRAIAPTPSQHQGSCPSGCHRCHHSCPTGALDAEGRIDARRCISYLTIEHRGAIDDALKPLVGSWLFGCDLCQEVCPFNLKTPATTEPEFLAWRAGPSLALDDILDLDESTFTKRFGGSPVHRTGRSGLVRNACLVAANEGRVELLPRLLARRDDSDAGVRDAARWAVATLQQERLP